jgi:WD40 repeat protein
MPPTNYDMKNDQSFMNNAIVRILTNDEPHQPVGAGFLVSPHHILTCAHVVTQALKLPENSATRPKALLYVDFPLLNGRPRRKASVHQWYPLRDQVVNDEFEDISVLVLSSQTPKPNEARSIPIIGFEEEAFENESKRAVRMCGFPKHQENKVCLNGTLQKTIAPGLVHIEIKSSMPPKLTGFSGTPVWDKQEQAVVGMIVSLEHRNGKSGAKMITSASLVKAWPELELYSSPNPYRGLQAFGEKDHEYFFGRETLIQPLHTAVKKQPFAAVIGTKGSGKTSLIFAGLVPRLRQENWLIIECCPKNQPFSELSKAFVPFVYPKLNQLTRREKQNQFADKLSQGEMTLSYMINLVFHDSKLEGKRLLLIIEQFEQLYTLNSDDVQQRFLATLLQSIDLRSQKRSGGLAPDFTLLLSMRADVMEQAVTHSDLAEALNHYHKAILGPMTSANLRAAIEKPAGNQGVTLEAGLTDRILQDFRQSEGHLSRLQFTLTQLWERLEYWQLTHRAYNAIGGLNNALKNHQDEFYNHLNHIEKQLLTHLMLQLVRPINENQYMRQVVIRAHLSVDAWDLAKRLTEKGLLLIKRNQDTGQETVQLADQILISDWQQLRDWLDEDRRFRLWQAGLHQALQAWKKSRQNEASLLQGAPLTEAEAHLKKDANQLDSQEKEFINASIASSQRKRAARERLQKERQQLRRRSVFGLASFVVIMLGLSFFIGWQWWKNKQQLIQENTQQAIELKQQAEKTRAEVRELRLKATQANIEAEQWRLQTERQLRQTEQLYQKVLLSHSLALATLSQVENQKGLATNAVLLALEALPKNTVIPDRPYLPNAEKALYDAVFNLREHLVLDRYNNDIRHAALSPDLKGSKVLTVAKNDNLVRLWDSDSGRLLIVFKGHQSPVNHATFSPNGQRILTSSMDGSARIWETETGTQLSVMRQSYPLMYSAFSPNASKVVTTQSKVGSAILWDAESGETIHRLEASPESYVPNKPALVEFSPDGSKIATLGTQQAYLWGAKNGQLLFQFKHEKTVTHLAFSHNSSQLITCSSDHTARLWDALSGKLIQEFKHEHQVTYAAFSPNDQRIVTVSKENIARLWKTESGELINELPHYSIVTHAAFSPVNEHSKGDYLVTTSYDHTARLWDGLNGQLIGQILGHESIVSQTAFSSDGQRILTTSADSTVRLWDLLIAGNDFFDMLQEEKESVNKAAFSPDGRRVVTISDKTLRVWDTKNQSTAHRFARTRIRIPTSRFHSRW